MDSVGNAVLEVKTQLDKRGNPFRLLEILKNEKIPIFIKERTPEERKDNGYFLEVTINDSVRHFVFYKKVSKTSTIKQLKQMVFLRYAIPPSEQIWIINQKVISASERLVDLKLEHLAMFFPVNVMTLHELSWPQSEVTSKTASKWKCPRCSFENHIMSAICHQCHENRDEKVVEEEHEYARMENGGNAAPEEIHGIPEDLMDILQWQCSNCNLENSPNQTECVVCSTIRPENFEIQVQLAMQEYRKHGKEGVIKKKNKERISEAEKAKLIREFLGWECVTCTYKNFPQVTTCDRCSSARPRNYNLPTKEEEDTFIKTYEAVQKEGEEEEDETHDGLRGKGIGWLCLACSHINDPKCRTCAKCKLPPQTDHSINVGQNFEAGLANQKDIMGLGKVVPNQHVQGEWSCTACSFVNRPGRPGCEICGEAAPEQIAYPPQAARPLPVLPKPAKVAKPKPQVAARPQMRRQAAWTCVQCTYQNEPGVVECEMCGRGRPDDERAPVPIRNVTPEPERPPVRPTVPANKNAQWSCGACSFINRPGRPGCEICGAPPPDGNAQPIVAAPDMPAPARPQAQALPAPARPQALAMPQIMEMPKPKPQQRGWECPQCTFLNAATRHGCEICSAPPPDGFVVVEDQDALERQKRQEEEFLNRERARQEQVMEELRAKQDLGVILTTVEIECPMCFTEAEVGHAVQLRNCGHHLCKDCLTQMVEVEETGQIECPTCELGIDDRDIKNVINPALWERRLRMVEKTVAKDLENVFLCQTTDCDYYVEVVDEVNDFVCKMCGNKNCLLCKAIHEKDETCQDYQDKLKRNSQNDENARLTMQMFEELIGKGEALRCPKCAVILQKKDGCDWVRCSVCKLEICWATRGPRWGPNGRGDNSGGCRCRVGGKPCTPTCRNCH